MIRILFFLVMILSSSTPLLADTHARPSYRDPVNGSRDNDYSDQIEMSPKPGWRGLPEGRASSSDRSTPWWAEAILWIPNRLMDFIDIFRVDVGVGPAIGGVIRVTRHGQAGYRRMLPFSLRVGDFGRSSPVVIETDNERGSGSNFHQSIDRSVCNGELGLGLDLGVGAYAGICSEELLDFFAGLIFIDLEDDDI
jgi:hypothetical protein